MKEPRPARAEAPTRLALLAAPSMFRDGLRAILEAIDDFRIVGEADDLADARRALVDRAAEILIVDISSAGVGWVDAMAQLRRGGGSSLQVLTLAADPDELDLAYAVTAGVTGFLLKGEETANLILAVRAVARGDAWLSPPVARRLLDDYCARLLTGNPVAAKAQPEPSLSRLSPRELSVLRLVAYGRSNAEIAKTLTLGEATVKTHVSRLLTKLELRDRVQLAVYAHRNGVS